MKDWTSNGTPMVPAREGEGATYQLGERLDPSGNVYEGFHRRFSERFLVKLFPGSKGARPEAVRSFAREAGRISILRHPHIVQILDSGIFVDRTPFVAMERLSGHTLERSLDAGPLPLQQLLPVLRGIVSALTAAHSAGVVHREIRPDNVFLVEHADGGAGVAKVLDFGISQLTWATGAEAGLANGAACYIAPEQVHGGLTTADVRTDVFSLAALTYRMLSGRDAFPTPINVDTLDSWAAHLPRPIIPSLHGVSALDAVLYKALDRHPDGRYPSVAAFFRAFEEALANAEPAPEPSRKPRVVFKNETDGEGSLRPATLETIVKAASDEPLRRDTASADPTVRLRPVPQRPDRRPSLTQQFFDKGDEFERTRWKNARASDQADAPPAPLEFTSFNRIPRRRTPLLIVLAAVLLLGGGLAASKLGAPSPRQLWAASRVGRTFHMFREGLPWTRNPPADATSVRAANAGSMVPASGAPASTANALPAPRPGPDPSNLAPVPSGSEPAPAPANTAVAVAPAPSSGVSGGAGLTPSSPVGAPSSKRAPPPRREPPAPTAGEEGPPALEVPSATELVAAPPGAPSTSLPAGEPAASPATGAGDTTAPASDDQGPPAVKEGATP